MAAGKRGARRGSTTRWTSTSRALEERTGKRFGDAARPAARLGALGRRDLDARDDGHDPQPRPRTTSRSRGWRRSTGNPRFAYDSYRRLIQMYGEVVDGVDGHRFEDALTDLQGRDAASRTTSSSSADDLRELIGTFKRIYEEEVGEPLPAGRRASSCAAPTGPCSTPGTRPARRSTAAPTRSPTTSAPPCNVVQMVFGNKGEGSGTGVCFTRDPSTGERVLYGEFLVNAQGEDVVAGIRTPEPIAAMRERLPEAYAQLIETLDAARGPLPRHAGHRVHGRGGHALPPADAHRQAHRDGGAADRGRDGRRGADLHARRRSRASTRASSTSSCTR